MSHYFADALAFWSQLPDIGGTTIRVMVAMCLFSTFLARVILQTTVNGLPMLFAGMLAGCFIAVHVLQYNDVLGFGRTEFTDASLACMIGIATSILPTAFLMRVLSWDR